MAGRELWRIGDKNKTSLIRVVVHIASFLRYTTSCPKEGIHNKLENLYCKVFLTVLITKGAQGDWLCCRYICLVSLISAFKMIKCVSYETKGS